MTSYKILGFLCGATLPLISFTFNEVEFEVSTYKIIIPLMLLLFAAKIKNFKVNKNLIISYSVLLIYCVVVYLINANSISASIAINDFEKEVIYFHQLKQFGVFYIFITLFFTIAVSNIPNIFLSSVLKGFLYSLLIHSLIAIIFLLFEFTGVIHLEDGPSFGIYKMHGVLGEPKQFGAAMFAAYLLMQCTLKNSKICIIPYSIFNKLLVMFFIMAVISFSSAVLVNIILFLILFLSLHRPLIFKSIFLACFLGFIFLLLQSDPCSFGQEREGLRDGIFSIVDKIKNIENIISFIPKDGIVILDLACRPHDYIFGSGPGALYHKIMRDDVANFHWYAEIGIFKSIVMREEFITEGPSTLQITLLSDYGFVGIFLIISFLFHTERSIRKSSSKNNFLLFYFSIFFNSLSYLWLLMALHLMAIKLSSEKNNLS